MVGCIAILLLVICGAAQVFIAAPYSWLFLHPVVFVVPLAIIFSLRRAKRIAAGWLFGIAANVATFYWIVHTVRSFSNLPAWVGVLILIGFAIVWSAYLAVFAWGARVVRGATPRFWPLAIPVWFVACEFLNPQLFPYFQGVAWYQVPSIFLVTSLTGVPGMSFVVLLWNCNLLLVFERLLRSEDRPAGRDVALNLTLCAFITGCAFAWSMGQLVRIETAEQSAPALRVALIQANQDVERAARLRAERREAHAEEFCALSREALRVDPEVEVVVWPEGALDDPPETYQCVLSFVRETGVELWVGAVAEDLQPDRTRRVYNSAYRMRRDGVLDRRYDKKILLPFGEFMPFEETLTFLKKIEGPGRLDPGRGHVLFDLDKARFVFLICYEAIRQRYVREAVRLGADLLVNITYDAWFGDTVCPHQHLMLAATQAAQFGRPMVRCATTGISALIDARGVIRQRTSVFQREALTGEVRLAAVESVYGLAGDWFGWSCAAAAALLAIHGLRRRRRGL